MTGDTRPIAFFDFDGTLTRGDTLMPFLKFVVGPRRYYLGLCVLSPILVAYLLGVLPNSSAKERVISYYLRGFQAQHLALLGRMFATDRIPALVCPRMMERLMWHQEQGHRCVLVSASPETYIRPFSEDHHFSDAIATKLHVEQGQLSGRFEGENCYGAEKLRLVKEYAASSQPSRTYAYGDSGGDKPMLHWVDEGYRIRRPFVGRGSQATIETV